MRWRGLSEMAARRPIALSGSLGSQLRRHARRTLGDAATIDEKSGRLRQQALGVLAVAMALDLQSNQLRRQVRRVLAVATAIDGGSRREVAAAFGISTSSLHRWIFAFNRGGVDGLLDNSHRPPLPSPSHVQPGTSHQAPGAREMARRAG
jgi:hypothetical protein